MKTNVNLRLTFNAMGKLKKDGIKNIYCSTFEKWMTKFYVSRHIHSKFHFTKKLIATERLHKKRSRTKRLKERQSGANKNCKQKKNNSNSSIGLSTILNQRWYYSEMQQ